MKSIILSLFLIFSVGATAQLKINEIMPNNVSAVLDDSYNYSMWVELYNPGSTISYNQISYYFTDDLTQPKKWRPSSSMVPPGGYSLLWFERDDRFGHASFKLEPDGGKLYMFDINELLIDSVIYPAQFRNISYGRKTDGASEWVYFEQSSAGASNNNKIFGNGRCAKPVFKIAGGFYASAPDMSFETPLPGETIYYTINNAEPTIANSYKYTPGAYLTLRSTVFIRAKTFSAGKLSSDIATKSFFIAERNFNLPVVSIITEQANLTDNTIGIYCDGTNGIPGNGQPARNYNQDWDRPVNYELYDTTGVSRLNQEVDITILGGWTRANGQKSIAIKPKKKFGENRLRYDVFAATKPNRNYKDIQMRNSGNDFGGCMMRDAFMQSLIMKRMDLDYLAYEPAVIYINGVYFGIQNLRERSNADFMYSNYGLEEDKVTWIEATNLGVDTDKDIATDAGFASLSNFLKNNDITNAAVYKQVCDSMDVDEFANYMIPEIYYSNNDWPNNNVKMWKTKAGGKWRWILFDTDFGFGNVGHNTLTFALGENTAGLIGGYSTAPDWSTVVFRRLMLNETFRNKFIDRFSIHISTTFETNRVNHVMDSLSAKIASEIVFHKAKWGGSSFSGTLNNMKSFGVNRPGNMLGFISSRFLNSAAVQTIKLSANVPGASYKMNNEPIIDSNVSLKYFNGRTVAMEARPVPGYKFKQWELGTTSSTVTTLIAMGSNWKYNDGNAMPAANWSATTYSDAAWKSGNAPLGYVLAGVVTTIGYGGVPTNKYPTAYFRKTVNITGLATKSNFSITTFVDDGAAVYVNGTEIGRNNMPAGTLLFTTLASGTNNGTNSTYQVPVNLLKEGDNVIAVEVHQGGVTSSDLIFNLSLTCDQSGTPTIFTSAVYNTVLSADLNLKAIYEVSAVEPDVTPTIVINEILSANTLITDEYGEKDDYIEVFNYGESDINIAGWYLTDTPANLTLSQIPATDIIKTNVPSKGRIILWADDQAVQGVTHLGFKLSKDGEKVILSRTNLLGSLVPVDSVSFPSMIADLSFSRVPDGDANWLIRPTTFNISNGDLTALESPRSNVTVYPTMVRESFYVNNAKGLMLTITDLTGKVLMQKQSKEDQETVQAGFLQRGLYILTVGNSSAYKIIKL